MNIWDDAWAGLPDKINLPIDLNAIGSGANSVIDWLRDPVPDLPRLDYSPTPKPITPDPFGVIAATAQATQPAAVANTVSNVARTATGGALLIGAGALFVLGVVLSDRK